MTDSRSMRERMLDELLGAFGDDVQIGPRVQLLTATHPVAPELRRQKWESAAPITIGDNAWLGGGATVLCGVDHREQHARSSARARWSRATCLPTSSPSVHRRG